ncbi:MAG TPA: family 1 encapsulin nanocompartment shell protein, partial [Sphaerochaeta sp.]|nr:family 1 encapsulin nanocompartment shell protein [Sphaerochaeta sp.]
MFKRNLAPISNRAWSEIEERAKLVLLSRLSARKVVSVNGPHGLDYTVLSEGRLSL